MTVLIMLGVLGSELPDSRFPGRARLPTHVRLLHSAFLRMAWRPFNDLKSPYAHSGGDWNVPGSYVRKAVPPRSLDEL